MQDKITVDQYKKMIQKPSAQRRSNTSAGKDFIGMLNLYFMKLGYIPQKEHMFHSSRKWRLDLAFVDVKLGIEYEGIMSAKSRHTTVTGYTNDIEKYKAAEKLGWKILRYTVLNKDKAIQEIEEELQLRNSNLKNTF